MKHTEERKKWKSADDMPWALMMTIGILAILGLFTFLWCLVEFWTWDGVVPQSNELVG